MTLKSSVAVRNAMLDAVETAIGQNAVMKIRSGAPPAAIANADTGIVIATIQLPADWLANAANATKAKLGTWQDLQADAAGTAGHYRIYAAGGTVPHIQGTITATGGGGDMEVSNTVLAANQEFSVSDFSLTLPDAV